MLQGPFRFGDYTRYMGLSPEDEKVLNATDLRDLPKVLRCLPQIQGRLQGFLQTPQARAVLGEQYDILKRLLNGSPQAGQADLQLQIEKIGQSLWDARKKTGRKSLEEKVMEALPGTELLGNVMRFTDVLPDVQGNSHLVHQRFRDFFPTADKRYPWRMRALIALAHAMNFPGGRSLVAWGATLGTKKMARRFIAGANPVKASPFFRKMASKSVGVIADILGEEIKSEKEADAYMRRYQALVSQLISDKHLLKTIRKTQSQRVLSVESFKEKYRLDSKISLKLSSLYSQWNVADPEGTAAVVKSRLRPILRDILRAEKEEGIKIGLAIDMEQFQYRDLTYKIFKEIFDEPEFRSMENIEIVVQAYLRDALEVIRDLGAWSRKRSSTGGGESISIRLAKGAYVDQENIWSDQKGFPLPVFTEKWMADANFEECVDLLLDQADDLRLAVASHNIRSISYAVAQARHRQLPVSFQVLMGMDEAGVDAMVKEGLPVEMFAPMGKILEGMAYLARRMLENGSQDSFLRSLFAKGREAIAQLMKNPIDGQKWPPIFAQPQIPTLDQPFKNEPQIDFSREGERQKVMTSLKLFKAQETDHTIVASDLTLHSKNPSSGKTLGSVSVTHPILLPDIVKRSKKAGKVWSLKSVRERAEVLHRAAAIMRTQKSALTALLILETGKTVMQADLEVAEAIDFLEFNARQALNMEMKHPELDLKPKGVVGVISPWNFALAILANMVTAPLVAGNSVIMKPSEEAPLIAKMLYEILLTAGVPGDVLQLVPGDRRVGEALVDQDINHIAFTGSKRAGLHIYEKAMPRGISVTAELGGINTHIVSEDTNPDDMINAVRNGKFGYGGQKCSAIQRVVFINSSKARYEDNLARLIDSLSSIHIGPADNFSSFYGPLIRKYEVQRMNRLVEEASQRPGNRLLLDGRLHAVVKAHPQGNFSGPTVIEVTDPHDPLLKEEIFGPILVVMRAKNLNEATILAQNVSTGLTAGWQGRSPSDEAQVINTLRDVGNLYINHESGTTGAVVGNQSFGGQKLSGIAGSKAGGDAYLWQFVDSSHKNAPINFDLDIKNMIQWMEERIENPNQLENLHSPLGIANSIDYQARGKGLVISSGDTSTFNRKAFAAAAKVTGNDVVHRFVSEDTKSLMEIAADPEIKWVSFLNCFDVDVANKAAQVTAEQNFIRPVFRFDDVLAQREKVFQILTEPRTVSVNYARHGQLNRPSQLRAGKYFNRNQNVALAKPGFFKRTFGKAA